MPSHDNDYMPRVKICGLRDSDAALTAARAGADFLGFVFVEGVRRQLTPFQGQEIVRGYRIRTRDHRKTRARDNVAKTVGLFRNQDAKWVNRVAQQVDLDYIQLCGDEDEAYTRAIWKPIFRQVRVKPDANAAQLASIVNPHLAAGQHVILDTYDTDTPGGSGKRFNWQLAADIAHSDNVLLAGGLDPDNVAPAVEQLKPWGVDVSTGVETDGIKDLDKIRRFIQNAKSATSVEHDTMQVAC